MRICSNNKPGAIEPPPAQLFERMSRNRERQQEMQPERTEYARTRLEALGYPVTQINATTLQFTFRGSPVTLYPYSGWFTGKAVKDGRGIHNLLKQIPMRWALRKQDKIKAAFEPNGDEILTRIKESLTRYFAADRSEYPEGLRDIEDDFSQLPGEPYPTIAINDVGNDSRMIEFYVIGKQYDVYRLAFKGFTKC